MMNRMLFDNSGRGKKFLSVKLTDVFTCENKNYYIKETRELFCR